MSILCYEDGLTFIELLFKIPVKSWITHVPNCFVFIKFWIFNVRMIQSNYQPRFKTNVIDIKISTLCINGVINQNNNINLVSIDWWNTIQYFPNNYFWAILLRKDVMPVVYIKYMIWFPNFTNTVNAWFTKRCVTIGIPALYVFVLIHWLVKIFVCHV